MEIKDYPGYFINKRGDVWSTKSDKFLQQQIYKTYSYVGLCKNGKQSKKSISRLVAKTFIYNPENKPEVDHIDCNKQNNCVNNLRWCTSKENKEYAIANGLYVGVKRPPWNNKLKQKKIKHIQTGIIYDGIREAARRLNLNAGNICQQLKGNKEHVKKQTFEYIVN